MIRDNKELLVMKREKPSQLYYTLVGGGIDQGESKEQALHREVKEETGMDLANPREVFYDDHVGRAKGIQYVFLCDYVAGEPKLDPASEEFVINEPGINMHTPMWLSLQDLPTSNLMPPELKQAILTALNDGFPKKATKIE